MPEELPDGEQIHARHDKVKRVRVPQVLEPEILDPRPRQ
jgi:hypothetical protein